jgi:hypothetical protein
MEPGDGEGKQWQADLGATDAKFDIGGDDDDDEADDLGSDGDAEI